jgi:(p)ppGpp synthase/HD superfamily hydrolase
LNQEQQQPWKDELNQHKGPQQQQGGAAARPGADERLNGVVIEALKLALRCLAGQPPRRDGRTPAERALGLAAALADLAGAGLPVDAAIIAAAIVADAVDARLLHIRSVEAKLGPEVAGLVHDALAVRHAPERVELYDDEASR